MAQWGWDRIGSGQARSLTLREPQLASARAELAAAEANLETAQRNLERTEVRAPYAGRVREKNVDVGEFVTVGALVARIYAVDAAEVRLPLPDGDLAYLDLPLNYRGESGRIRGPVVTLRAASRAESTNGKATSCAPKAKSTRERGWFTSSPRCQTLTVAALTRTVLP